MKSEAEIWAEERTRVKRRLATDKQHSSWWLVLIAAVMVVGAVWGLKL